MSNGFPIIREHAVRMILNWGYQAKSVQDEDLLPCSCTGDHDCLNKEIKPEGAANKYGDDLDSNPTFLRLRYFIDRGISVRDSKRAT